ncbi:MGMT family protein [Allonocardiopsis opalescens]|uniref:O(6)-alkylguanine repair protein YbaZ n=1 Tax=Allonocardiopsis opalescens TaxID=1144618 RepID=A0A2T0QDM6_9ACTN|nr:MGMT family protein [Allonocardiopsis opalescens]PRY01992.1 O(6)-alkylguanine repair protein YbaZ [Allonocardiopsis opalescens]
MEPDEFAERVLDLVERIPPGRVMSYGDVAEYLGAGGPRQVGRVMALWGGAVPWWRVIRADGSPPPGHEVRAVRAYRAEGTPLRPGGVRVDMRGARWDGVEEGARG